jgi:hypothetical protein
LQLRGEDGQVVGTDGRQVLFWSGFRFPFSDNLLVPAIPVFGGRELAVETEVKIGRTAKHVLVAVGPWTVWLPIDKAAQFPEAASIIPKGTRLAKMSIEASDVADVLRALKTAPNPDSDRLAVKLEFGQHPRIGVLASSGQMEVELPHSSGSGPKSWVTMDGRYLERALALGLGEIRVAPSQEAIHFCDDRRSYLVARLDPRAAGVRTESSQQEAFSSCDEGGASRDNPVSSNGGPTVKSDSNGHSPLEQTAVDETVDPLAEAEALRAAMTEVVRRIGRLITGLRQYQKQRRALQAAWTSLKHLRLSSKEEA